MSWFKKKERPPVCDERLRHIAFIMDGNGRWAKKHLLPREAGHARGAETFRSMVRCCGEIGIRYVTVYAFSSENWRRSVEEVNAIMSLLEKYLDDAEELSRTEKFHAVIIGDLDRLTPTLRDKALRLDRVTSGYDRTVYIAVSYGGRGEITHAVNSLIAEGCSYITEEDISSHLYAPGIPEPDLVVRTGGDYRISNFLLWQSAYAEYYFTPTLWPDFSRRELFDAVRQFMGRERRFGGRK